MVRLLNRFILLLGIGITFPKSVQTNLLAIGLASITLSLIYEFGIKKLTIASYTIYFILCFIDPDFLLFYPLLFYPLSCDLLEKRYVGIPIFLLIFQISMSSIILSIVAFYLAYLWYQADRTQKRIKNLNLQNLHIANQTLLIEQNYRRELFQNEKIAQLSERERISRQLHDSIGHTITGSILALEALNVLQSNEMIISIRDNLQKGLDDIRAILYDEKYQSFIIEKKVQQLLSATGLHYQLVIQESELSYDMKIDIYSAIKEAITNTLKHSDATEMEIKLFCHPKNIILFLRDNGSKKIEVEKLRYSTGLNSLRELSIRYDGILELSYRQGFIIFMNIKREKL